MGGGSETDTKRQKQKEIAKKQKRIKSKAKEPNNTTPSCCSFPDYCHVWLYIGKMRSQPGCEPIVKAQ